MFVFALVIISNKITYIIYSLISRHFFQQKKSLFLGVFRNISWHLIFFFLNVKFCFRLQEKAMQNIFYLGKFLVNDMYKFPPPSIPMRSLMFFACFFYQNLLGIAKIIHFLKIIFDYIFGSHFFPHNFDKNLFFPYNFCISSQNAMKRLNLENVMLRFFFKK